MGEAPWSGWVGRQETRSEILHAPPAQALAATLNHDPATFEDTGAEMPPVWNWLYFLPRARMSEVGTDGHPKRGGFLPPITLPRRMWAGSRCVFHAPLRVGDTATKTSTILKVAEKTGRAGTMVFITVGHAIEVGGTLAYEEEQDIVYMAIPDVFTPPPPTPLPACDWQDALAVDPVLLFRFSALTFNGHRIHYDRAYATEIEHYPGLVVHGPLQAVALLDAACRHHADRVPARFSFRGIRPLFDFDAVTLNGRATSDTTIDLFTANADGAIGMEASVTWG